MRRPPPGGSLSPATGVARPRAGRALPARARAAAVVAAAAALLVAAACGDDPYAPLPVPETTSTEATVTTVPRDYSTVPLPVVPGVTTTTVDIGPGPASLVGIVTGPDGPVAGAIVRVERLVGESVATREVPTAADGTWNLMGILGGRYRVRAFQSPRLAQTTPEIFFLDGRGRRELRLRVEAFEGTALSFAFAPTPPPLRRPVNLVVRIAVRGVDPDGVVRAVPQPNIEVTLGRGGQWELQSANPVLTDAAGRASFTIECQAPGTQPLTVLLNGVESHPVPVADCTRPEPPTTTTTTADGGDGSTSTSTSTSSTTSTTEPD